MTISRRTLEADLLRHQNIGDFAAQAETLMALAKLADDDEAYRLAHGLYGQAWAAYAQVGDLHGMAQALGLMADAIATYEGRDPDVGFARANLLHLCEIALAFYSTLEDWRSQAALYKQIASGLGFGAGDITEAAWHNALRCYERLGDIKEQANTLFIMHYRYDARQPEYRQCLERALHLYHQIGDSSSEAYVQSELGQLECWSKHNEAAHAAFAVAIRLFTEAKDYGNVLHVIARQGLLLRESLGYESYRQHYRGGLEALHGLPVDKNQLMNFWSTLGLNARKHGDFATARHSFQQAILYATSSSQPDRQAEWYWQWGAMEYHEAGRKHMGYALCQRAISLFQHHDPDSAEHRKQWRLMGRDMHPSPSRSRS